MMDMREPWEVSDSYVDEIYDADGRLVARAALGRWGMMSRIAACVNALAGMNPEAVPEIVGALKNIRDTVESCYVAGDWLPLITEEMEHIASLANTALAKLEATDA